MRHIIVFLCFCMSIGFSQESCIASLQQQRKEALSKVTVGSAMYQIDKLPQHSAVVVFYKTDCLHCEKLLPQLLQLQKSYSSKGFRVIAVSLDEDLKTWQTYTAINKYEPFSNYCDGKSYLGKAATKYNVYGTPTLFLIDKDWKLYQKPKTITDLDIYIRRMLVL